MSAALACGSAFAGRPLETEDAGVLQRGECELESYATRERPTGAPRVNTLYAQLGCGIGAHTQFAAGIGREREAGEQTPLVGFAGKTALLPLTDGAGVTIAYALRWTRPAGASLGRDTSEIKGVLTVPVHEWLVHANLGPRYDHRVREWSTAYGVALERPGALGPLDFMAEVFGTDRERPSVQFGIRWAVVPERVFIDGAFGRQLTANSARLISMGLKYAF